MMKVRKALSLLLFLVLALILSQSANARPPQQSISLQVEVTPNADGTYHIRGSVVATGLHPEGQQIVTNEVDVHVEFMAGAGSWPVFYEWWSHANQCYTIGVEQRCATEEELSPRNVSASSIFAQTLSDSDDGETFSFEADVEPPDGAGQMQVVARFEHTYTCGACYWDARQYLWDVYGPIDVTAITPPPTTEPTVVEATAVLPPTPGPSPTVIPCDLSIQDAVAVLQAVEGGNLVGGRDVAVLVRPYWAYEYPEGLPSGYQIKVSVDVDGNQVSQKTGGIGEVFEFILPASLFPAGFTTEHHILIEAEVVGADCVDHNRFNNRVDRYSISYASRPMRLLFVRIQPHGAPPISASTLNQFAREAVPYLRQVYPVPQVRRVPGSYWIFPGLDTRWSVSVNVARTLSQHNSNRCRSHAPCNVPRADLAIGVFPGHYYGSNFEGWLYGRGSTIWGKWMDATAQGVGWLSGGGSSVDRAAITSADNFINSAHEIGHHFNLEDEYSTGNLGRPIQQVIIWQDGRLLNPSDCSGRFCPDYYNFMGNAGVGYPGTQYWVDANTWNKILGEINRRGFAMMPHQLASLSWHPAQEEIAEIEGPALLVMGLVDQQGQGTIHTIDRLNRYEELPTTEGEWLLEALDIAGTAMSEVHFDTYPLDIDEQVPFLVTLPVDDPTEVAQVRLSHAGSSHYTAVRSPTPPTVAFDLLPDFDGDTLTISWNTQDADGDELRSSLFYSSDGGQTWHVLGLDLPDTRLEIDPLTLPGGEAQFRAVVSDGLNETQILTSPIIVPDRPPSAYVELPWGDTFAADEPVILHGYGYDLEDGDIPSAELQWQDEAGQSLGQGPRLEIAGLASGEHRIILLAQDSVGQTSRAEVTVTVEREPLTGLINPILLLFLFGTAGMAGLASFALFLFLLATRRRPAPAAPLVTPPRRPPPPVRPSTKPLRPRGRPEEFVDRGPPGPPESFD